MQGKLKLLVPLLIATLLLSPTSADISKSNNSKENRYAKNAIDLLNKDYSGEFLTFMTWHSANIMENLANYMIYTNDTSYVPEIELIYNITYGNIDNFIDTMYNDDLLWFSLGFLRSFDLTKDYKYVVIAEYIYEHLIQYWDDECGGGIYWNREMEYKNAITNLLFRTTSYKLSHLDWSKKGTIFYQEWYNKSERWINLQNNFINPQSEKDHIYLVNDGLTDQCQNNNYTTWTYNQGLSLYPTTDYTKSINIIDSTIGYLSDDGILQELCEFNSSRCIPECPSCDNDQSQFKGIFIRYLRYFLDTYKDQITKIDKNKYQKYEQFITRNRDQILSVYGNHDNEYGLKWVSANHGTYYNFVTQSSAIDLLSAAY